MSHIRRVRSVTFSPDGEHAASCRGSIVTVWETSSGKKLAEFQHSGWVNTVAAFSPDGKFLVSGDYTVIVRNIHNGRELIEFCHGDWIYSVRFSPDGELLASGGHDGHVMVWDVSSGENIAKFFHSGWVYSVRFSPDGRYLASGGGDWTAVVWDMHDGQRQGSLFNRQKIAEFHQSCRVDSVAFSPDGRYLAYGGGKNFQVAEWRNHKIIRTERHVHSVWSVSWFKRFPANSERGGFSPFVRISGKDIECMGFSRRGFLALGDANGEIAIIREGKEI